MSENYHQGIRRVMEARDWMTNPDDAAVLAAGQADNATPLYADIAPSALAGIVGLNLLTDPLQALYDQRNSNTDEALTASQAAGEFLRLVGVGSRVEVVEYADASKRAQLDGMLALLVTYCDPLTPAIADEMKALGTFTVDIWDWELRDQPGQGQPGARPAPVESDIAHARTLPWPS